MKIIHKLCKIVINFLKKNNKYIGGVFWVNILHLVIYENNKLTPSEEDYVEMIL